MVATTKIEFSMDQLQNGGLTLALLVAFCYLALVTLRSTWDWGRAWLVRRLVSASVSGPPPLPYDDDDGAAEDDECWEDDLDEREEQPIPPSGRRMRRVQPLSKRR